LCFALLCFALLCFALLCFALLCFALLCDCVVMNKTCKDKIKIKIKSIKNAVFNTAFYNRDSVKS
ncbi:hypothetical protein VXR23_12190, partial [Acinetobacter towneri]|uniref:hypothetical protein n=1 Tax=Acinetobacter towneri TaxID=202956 RepID=UPI003A8BDDB1